MLPNPMDNSQCSSNLWSKFIVAHCAFNYFLHFAPQILFSFDFLLFLWPLPYTSPSTLLLTSLGSLPEGLYLSPRTSFLSQCVLIQSHGFNLTSLFPHLQICMSKCPPDVTTCVPNRLLKMNITQSKFLFLASLQHDNSLLYPEIYN